MTASPTAGPSDARAPLPWWWLPAALAFIAIRFLPPHYIDNETGYALGPIRVLQPDVLSTHPFLERFNPFFWIFDLAASPFYLAFDWLWATLILRVLIWAFQLWALERLCRRLGLQPWATLLVLVLWLNVEQTLVAGEWIIGCASAKPVAYGFLFLALEATLSGRPAAAGVFSGVATCFHVLVGGWATAALMGAVLVSAPRDHRARTVLRVGLPAAVIGLVGLAPGLREVLAGSHATAGEAGERARLYVEWLNSYHVDPAYFMSPAEYVKIIAYGAVTLVGVFLLARHSHRTILVSFLGLLALIFAGGLLARRLEWWGVLKYYPFRVADGLYPLAFWVCVAGVVQLAVSRVGRPGWLLVVGTLPFASLVRHVNNRLGPTESREERASLLTSLLRSEPRMSAYWLRETGREWLSHARGDPLDDLDPMLAWIRANTPEDAVFIIPPWRDDFTLRARRAEFISSKTPVTERIAEYRDRLEALNGGPITGVGRAIFRDLRRNYPELTPEQIRAATERFGADYFLTPTDYGDALPRIHQAGPWRLYALREWQRGAGVPRPRHPSPVVGDTSGQSRPEHRVALGIGGS